LNESSCQGHNQQILNQEILSQIKCLLFKGKETKTVSFLIALNFKFIRPNCDICAEQNILFVNETKCNEIWLRPNNLELNHLWCLQVKLSAFALDNFLKRKKCILFNNLLAQKSWLL
jgi:hypothetical protein